ncbi:ATP-dependent nuclease [Pseudomonas sp. PDM20]|uniref:ATP-dependent nuclease n=1 Tax=Pseudomonas sp. PDM20 TaxID=2769254 RepID=UPI00177EAD18|nr:AAA family ATPase [Pseudomonas sp. PDM20]MBD9684997.1 AAA family ATPase [Pseudomonas sp. PDM20]
MAKQSAKKAGDVVDEIAPRARLHKLIIRNFRAIGNVPVTIELDDIVVLVGPNNAGKSSILRAYEVVMQSGKLNELSVEDFPGGKVPSDDAGLFPTIELETVLYEGSNPPAEKWVEVKENGDRHVKERWVWRDIGKPEKRGFNVIDGAWDENHGPWGVSSVAQVNRPEPHRIDAFHDPEEQAAEVVGLLQEAIKEKVKDISQRRAGEGEEKGPYEKLLESVAQLQRSLAIDAVGAIDEVKASLNTSIAEVFPGYSVSLDARPEDDLDKAISLFKAAPVLRMGPADGHQTTLERQGSGARRTLLWTALRILAEHNRAKPAKADAVERPHVLLLDEPEMCLHPSAIRDACNVLYSLPKSGKWQVVVTTHSPVFIDLSRDNTSIVRVERTAKGEVSGTTIFRPERARLSEDDREELKLLNIYDPYVAEFFFGGSTVVVEGDTEYTAFKEVIQSNKETFGGVHVVRARGKYTIVALCKILNQFGSPYAVLHDADTTTVRGKKGLRKNSAWAANSKILDVVNAVPGTARLAASIPNFEMAMFGEPADGEKPYGAWEKLRGDAEVRERVSSLLEYLVGKVDKCPAGVLSWKAEDQLAAAVKDYEPD